PRWGSGELNLLGLGALRALSHIEGHTLTLFEDLVSGHVDGGEVDEDVLAAPINGDEPKALFGVEPLNGSLGHVLLLAELRVPKMRDIRMMVWPVAGYGYPEGDHWGRFHSSVTQP